MKKLLRILSIALLFFTGLNATIAGSLFLLDPTGALMGMSVEYLKVSPFDSYLVPGIVLLVMNGILSLAAAVYAIQQKKNYEFAIIIQGGILCGWIAVQMIMVQDVNGLHITMLAIGSMLIGLGIALRKIQ